MNRVLGFSSSGVGSFLFDSFFGVFRHLDDQPQHLVVQLVGLVDAEQQIFF